MYMLRLLLMVGLWLLFTRVPLFHKAYTEHQARLEDARWIAVQCSDPRMRQLTTLCTDALLPIKEEAAWWVACQACWPREWWVLVAACALMLSLCLPLYRRWEERMHHRRLVLPKNKLHLV
jgi:hypothetical protein